MSILVFLGLFVLNLGPMYATDRRQTASSLTVPPIRGGGIINFRVVSVVQQLPVNQNPADATVYVP